LHIVFQDTIKTESTESFFDSSSLEKNAFGSGFNLYENADPKNNSIFSEILSKAKDDCLEKEKFSMEGGDYMDEIKKNYQNYVNEFRKINKKELKPPSSDAYEYFAENLKDNISPLEKIRRKKGKIMKIKHFYHSPEYTEHRLKLMYIVACTAVIFAIILNGIIPDYFEEDPNDRRAVEIMDMIAEGIVPPGVIENMNNDADNDEGPGLNEED